MSFLDAFIGGAAQTGMGIIDQRMRDDAEITKMQERGNIEQQLAIAKQEALRQINAEMGQKISDSADTTNRQRIADRINSTNGSEMSAEDAAAIAKNPEAMKAYGLSERSRAQEMDDLATAAGKYGATDQAKMYRDQQNVEVQRDSTERKIKADEERSRLAQAQLESRERIATATADQRERLAMARIEALANRQSTGNKEEKVISYLDGTRKTISEEATKLNQQMKIDLENAKYYPEEVKKIKEEYKPKLDEIEEKRKQLDEDFKASRKKFGLAEIPEKSAKATGNPPSDKERQPGQSDKPITKEEYAKLKSGDTFTAPDGSKRRKP